MRRSFSANTILSKLISLLDSDKEVFELPKSILERSGVSQ